MRTPQPILSEVQRLALMDAFLPGVAGWRAIYDNPNLWHFRFHGPTPLALVSGRERTYFDYYWNDFAANPNRSLSPADREEYVAAYSRPGRMAAGWAYFDSFPQTAVDFARLAATKLRMPVLSIGGDKANGVALGAQVRTVAENVTVVVLRNTGHWLLEENPQQTIPALTQFFGVSLATVRSLYDNDKRYHAQRLAADRADPRPVLKLAELGELDGTLSRARLHGLHPGLARPRQTVEELRADPTPLTEQSIGRVVDYLDAFVRKLEAPPIIMGHSFGGLFAQLLAYRGLGSAVVGVDPTAPAGVLDLPFSTLKGSAPVLANPFNIGKRRC